MAETKEKILKRIHKNLGKIIADKKLGESNPFDLDVFENVEFPTKKNAEGLWSDIYDYYKTLEEWKAGGNFVEYESIPPYILDIARKNGVNHITENVLKEAGGYLSSQWLVFVPFIRSSDPFSQWSKKKLSRNHTKIGNNIWLSNIAPDESNHFKWVHKNFKSYLRANKAQSWKGKISTFRHQLCQIGGAKYTPQEAVCNGHYLIFKFSGSMQSLSSKYDPSVIFYIFCRGLVSLDSKGVDHGELMATPLDRLEPNGIIGVSLKDFEPFRFRRNVMFNLNVTVSDDLLKKLKKNKFAEINENIYSSKSDIASWESLKKSAEMMYQFFENENGGGNAVTRKAVSTVLLCSASEAIFRLNGKSIKKNLSTYMATILEPKGGPIHNEIYSFFESAYKIRSKFVHEGAVENVDNKKLFFYVFSVWLKLALFYLKHKDSKKTYSDMIKGLLKNNSGIYRTIFFKDYID
jgi:hypothetical protein